MEFLKWLKENEIANKVKDLKVRKSGTCYQDSDREIRYFRLEKPVDGVNFILISRNLCEDFYEKKSYKVLADGDLVRDGDVFRVQRPDSTPVIDDDEGFEEA